MSRAEDSFSESFPWESETQRRGFLKRRYPSDHPPASRRPEGAKRRERSGDRMPWDDEQSGMPRR